MIELEKQENIYNAVKNIIEQARNTVYKAVNYTMIISNWDIGQVIVEEEQQGKDKAQYGKYIIKNLAQRLTIEYGEGYNEAHLRYCRLFYKGFPIRHAVRDELENPIQSIRHAARDEFNLTLHPLLSIIRTELSWTHYRILLKVEKELARQFYMNEAANSNWNTRQLERQINSLLYERIALSKDNSEVLELANKGMVLQKPSDLIKDPFVLEFAGIKQNLKFLEKDLEQALIDKLSDFLLELGKGFSFVARQERITMDNEHFYIDLVFYNFLLKCFVLLDLKVGKLTYKDIGQMDGYVRLYEEKYKSNGNNPTIGIILCTEKNETIVKFSLLKDSEQVFASKYKLYIPTEQELIEEIEREKQWIELQKDDIE